MLGRQVQRYATVSRSSSEPQITNPGYLRHQAMFLRHGPSYSVAWAVPTCLAMPSTAVAKRRASLPAGVQIHAALDAIGRDRGPRNFDKFCDNRYRLTGPCAIAPSSHSIEKKKESNNTTNRCSLPLSSFLGCLKPRDGPAVSSSPSISWHAWHFQRAASP